MGGGGDDCTMQLNLNNNLYNTKFHGFVGEKTIERQQFTNVE